MRSLFEEFTQMYPVSKTLRFELKPQGKTLNFLEKNGVLDNGEKKAQDYKRLKILMDSYYKAYINRVLADVELEKLEEFEAAYNKIDKSPKDKKELEKLQKDLRKQVITLISDDEKFKTLFKKELIEQELIEFLEEDDDINLVKSFKGFTTMCQGFWTNRKNIFSPEAKATSIAYRTIHENLPRFINNKKIFNKYIMNDSDDEFKCSKKLLSKAGVKRIEDVFSLEYFSRTLTQTGIDTYNSIIGGFSENEHTKIQGINELINLHNQKNSYAKIGLLQPLYKQILSDRRSLSFVSEQFDRDYEVIDSIKIIFDLFKEHILKEDSGTLNVLTNLDEYNTSGIYIKNDTNLTELSRLCYGEWNAINEALYTWYDKNEGNTENITESYNEKRKKYFSKLTSIDIAFINETMGGSIASQMSNYISEVKSQLYNSWESLSEIVENGYPQEKNLIQDDITVRKIKTLLDSMKNVETLIRIFSNKGDETEVDDVFYGELDKCMEILDLLNSVYNKIRNYITRKPYSNEKIKLTFDTPQLMDGWALSKEKDNKAVLLRRDGLYYLGIMDKRYNKIFENLDSCEDSKAYEKMEYFMSKDVNLSIPKSSTQMKDVKAHFEQSADDYTIISKEYIKPFTITKEEFDLNNVLYEGKKKWQKDYLNITGDIVGYDKAVKIWIKFCMRFLESYGTTQNFDFSDVYPLEQYKHVNDFYEKANKHLYKITFKNVSVDYIDKLVEEGKLYLFQIYNKDFSTYSKGRPNLHTMYWKACFAEENMKNEIYKLNGNAEIFYRKRSINLNDAVVHPANQAIANKNANNTKRESLFDYDIIKDKRYTVDKFQFHVSITMNYQSSARTHINNDIRRAIKNSDNMHIIGIDRGERHLLYVTVIDLDGNIKEQFSLNEIINEYNNQVHCIDYHRLLDAKEKERLEARQEWRTINNIKELKDGYMSQVVHIIAQLMIKYNAIVVMEDLNFGFMRGRQKVEKQVYQKFEKALITKLNYYVGKTVNANEIGGVYKALQLTDSFTSFKTMGKQNGALFYVPAWNTSKMDPTTGFVNLLYPKHENIKKSKSFVEKIKSISYVSEDDKQYFAFEVDYKDYTSKADGARTDWTICSYGKRITNKRNKEGYWESQTIDITEAWRSLFDNNDINIDRNIKEQILKIDDAGFFKSFMHLLKLTLQIRNSEINSDVDYMISPVKNKSGEFFCTDNVENKGLPINADANGAYNIARKGLWIVEQFKRTEEECLKDVNLSISNIEWMKYAQRGK